MRQEFLESLRKNMADLATWQIYADWLEDKGDPTAEFIRESLCQMVGSFDEKNPRKRLVALERVLERADLRTRRLMASYRDGLPTRFRVVEIHVLGQAPPTHHTPIPAAICWGYLETGQIWPGMDLGVVRRQDHRPLTFNVIWGHNRYLFFCSAGRPPLLFALEWQAIPDLQVGDVLLGGNDNQ